MHRHTARGIKRQSAYPPRWRQGARVLLKITAMASPLLIGFSARIYTPGTPGIHLDGVWTRTLHFLEQSVAHWVLRGGAVALMIPAVSAGSVVKRGDLNLRDYARALDGLVLQGGNDVAPETYGQTPQHPDWHGDRVRDLYEIELVNAFVEAGKPVFGICRGLQLLNVMHGGTLVQDIPSQRPNARAHRDSSNYERHFHDIEILPGTRLATLYGGLARARVNSIHHQAIEQLAPGFVVEARCPDDGTIEAVRHDGAAWIAAVQWHPEFHVPGDPSTFDDSPLLADFLSAAHAARRRAGPAS